MNFSNLAGDDEVELILRPNRLKNALFTLLCAAFAAAGVLMVRSGEALGWLEIAFFGTGTVVFCALILPGSAYLRLEPAGFTVCSLFRTQATRWFEVEGFATTRISGRRMVGFNYSTFHQGQPRLRRLASAMSGYEAALPDTYGMKADSLAELMNQWRSEHAADSSGSGSS
jgi:hypothetical protein